MISLIGAHRVRPVSLCKALRFRSEGIEGGGDLPFSIPKNRARAVIRFFDLRRMGHR